MKAFFSLVILGLLSAGMGQTVSDAQEVNPAQSVQPLHLREIPMSRWLKEDKVGVIVSNYDIGGPAAIFDGDISTVCRSEQVNPMVTHIQFDIPVSLRGIRVMISHHVGRWHLEARLTPDEATHQEARVEDIIPWMEAGDWEWNEVIFPSAHKVSELRLTVERAGGDDYVHLNECQLLTDAPKVEVPKPEAAP